MIDERSRVFDPDVIPISLYHQALFPARMEKSSTLALPWKAPNVKESVDCDVQSKKRSRWHLASYALFSFLALPVLYSYSSRLPWLDLTSLCSFSQVLPTKHNLQKVTENTGQTDGNSFSQYSRVYFGAIIQTDIQNTNSWPQYCHWLFGPFPLARSRRWGGWVIR